MNLAFPPIVAATDFSEQAQLAFEYARLLASGLARFFMGSVAERVVQSAPCPCSRSEISRHSDAHRARS